MMKVVKVSFHEEDIAALTAQAKAAGLIGRAHPRALSWRQDNGTAASIRTPSEFNRLVAEAHRETHGTLSRSQVEALVAFVFTRMARPQLNHPLSIHSRTRARWRTKRLSSSIAVSRTCSMSLQAWISLLQISSPSSLSMFMSRKKSWSSPN